MKPVRLALPAMLLAATAVLMNCGDSAPLAPQQPTIEAQVAFDMRPQGLLACAADPFEVNWKSVGPEGGVIRIGRHMLRVPRGALSRTVTISASSAGIGTNQVRFRPEGLRFAVPATLTMSYDNCRQPVAPIRIAYIDGWRQILYYVRSEDDKVNKRVVGHLDHFSDYALAW